MDAAPVPPCSAGSGAATPGDPGASGGPRAPGSSRGPAEAEPRVPAPRCGAATLGGTKNPASGMERARPAQRQRGAAPEHAGRASGSPGSGRGLPGGALVGTQPALRCQ